MELSKGNTSAHAAPPRPERVRSQQISEVTSLQAQAAPTSCVVQACSLEAIAYCLSTDNPRHSIGLQGAGHQYALQTEDTCSSIGTGPAVQARHDRLAAAGEEGGALQARFPVAPCRSPCLLIRQGIGAPSRAFSQESSARAPCALTHRHCLEQHSGAACWANALPHQPETRAGSSADWVCFTRVLLSRSSGVLCTRRPMCAVRYRAPQVPG